MSDILHRFRRLLNNRSGATSIEYALLAALIAIAIVLSAAAIGTQLNQNFVDVADSFPNSP